MGVGSLFHAREELHSFILFFHLAYPEQAPGQPQPPLAACWSLSSGTHMLGEMVKSAHGRTSMLHSVVSAGQPVNGRAVAGVAAATLAPCGQRRPPGG